MHEKYYMKLSREIKLHYNVFMGKDLKYFLGGVEWIGDQRKLSSDRN